MDAAGSSSEAAIPADASTIETPAAEDASIGKDAAAEGSASDLGAQAEKVRAAQQAHAAKIIPGWGICILLFILPLFTMIPACYHKHNRRSAPFYLLD
ncbi:hypothetical protein ANACOL_00043 [Anaerotruncus colihominis DSM 17241]|uniref:Uncharacterized protein n=1 Tax=Anaerotruncus colihominis DSM 17241 TaxID=445972 RepID=B0P5M1_9FIRM|nr:hypothetical protein ANACOL_00043 [Anaerotruncus colihominis DSM 17241]